MSQRKTPQNLGHFMIGVGALAALKNILILLLPLDIYVRHLRADHWSMHAFIFDFLNFIFAAALVWIGAGLVKRRPWSRTAGILWAVSVLIYFPFDFDKQMMDLALKNYSNINEEATFEQLFTFLEIMMIDIPFPLIVLFLLGRPSAKNDFKPSPNQTIPISS